MVLGLPIKGGEEVSEKPNISYAAKGVTPLAIQISSAIIITGGFLISMAVAADFYLRGEPVPTLIQLVLMVGFIFAMNVLGIHQGASTAVMSGFSAVLSSAGVLNHVMTSATTQAVEIASQSAAHAASQTAVSMSTPSEHP